MNLMPVVMNGIFTLTYRAHLPADSATSAVVARTLLLPWRLERVTAHFFRNGGCL